MQRFLSIIISALIISYMIEFVAARKYLALNDHVCILHLHYCINLASNKLTDYVFTVDNIKLWLFLNNHEKLNLENFVL